MSVKVIWSEGMAFDVHQDGHSFAIDATDEFGGKNKGPRPKALMLSALAGCTAMDVVAILEKLRTPFDRFEVEVEGQLTDDHPKIYTEAKVIYRLWGAELPEKEKKVRRAVRLSEEIYCGVSATLEKAMTLSSEIWVNDKRLEPLKEKND